MNKEIEFLLRAKKATYASGDGSFKTKSSRPNSHDLIYSEENLKYIDTYVGSLFFGGEEAIWKDEKPFWCMNYYGRVLEDEFKGSFLKSALRNVPKDKPFRGPCEYREDNFLYTCKVDGDFNFFYGKESIYFEEKLVYDCLFHGGKVIDK